MPRISNEKESKIKESILYLLFHNSPKLLFTVQIAKELARDEEYTKKLLLDLEEQELLVSTKKNMQGKDYSRRIRWRLSNKAYGAYSNIFKQTNKFL
jgi:hypothetical protein